MGLPFRERNDYSNIQIDLENPPQTFKLVNLTHF